MAAIAKPEFDKLHQRFIGLFDSVSKRERIILLREMMVRPVEWFKVFLRWWFYEQPSFLGENLKIYTQCMALVQGGDESKLSAETKASAPMYLWSMIHKNFPAQVMWDAYLRLGTTPGISYIRSGRLLFVYDPVPADASTAVPKRVSRLSDVQLPEDLECDEFKHETKEWKTVFPKSNSVDAYLKYLDALPPSNHSGLTYSVSDATRAIALIFQQTRADGKAPDWVKNSLITYLEQISLHPRRIIIQPAVFEDKQINFQPKKALNITHTDHSSFSQFLVVRNSLEYFQCVECCLAQGSCAISGAVRCLKLTPDKANDVNIQWDQETQVDIRLVRFPAQDKINKVAIKKALEKTIALFQDLPKVSARLMSTNPKSTNPKSTNTNTNSKLLFLVALWAAYLTNVAELNFFYGKKPQNDVNAIYTPIHTSVQQLVTSSSYSKIDQVVDYIESRLP